MATQDVADILKKVQRIQIVANRTVNDLFAGQYKSVFRGRGMEFDEVREYQPGDDIRTIDWKVTARTQKPHVRVFTEERERPALLVVDQRIEKTLLELAVLARDEEAASDALADALASLREGWEAETTARNLRLIREARAA